MGNFPIYNALGYNKDVEIIEKLFYQNSYETGEVHLIPCFVSRPVNKNQECFIFVLLSGESTIYREVFS